MPNSSEAITTDVRPDPPTDPQDLATALAMLQMIDRSIAEQTQAIKHIEYWRDVQALERERLDLIARRMLRQGGCPDGAVIDGPGDTRWLVVGQRLVQKPRVRATVPVAEAVVEWPAASSDAEAAEFGPRAGHGDGDADGCGCRPDIPAGRREESREVAIC